MVYRATRRKIHFPDQRDGLALEGGAGVTLTQPDTKGRSDPNNWSHKISLPAFGHQIALLSVW
jgi:hypothetical protein